eukprot:scaffold20608_cov140-Isochrysis_galbana.AAC.2
MAAPTAARRRRASARRRRRLRTAQRRIRRQPRLTDVRPTRGQPLPKQGGGGARPVSLPIAEVVTFSDRPTSKGGMSTAASMRALPACCSASTAVGASSRAVGPRALDSGESGA